MTISATTTFNATTGVISGTLSSNIPIEPPINLPVEPVSGVVVSAYDGSATNGGAYFAQARTDGGGNFSLSTATLAAGQHEVVLTADYEQIIATLTITAAGPGIAFAGATRCDLPVNNIARS